MKNYLKKFLLIFLGLPLGCSLTMSEVNRELMPHIEKNQHLIETLQKENEKALNKLREDVSGLELAVSTLRDRIQSLHNQVIRDLASQNDHLARLDQMQLDVLEGQRLHLQGQLKMTLEMIQELQSKLKQSGEPIDSSTLSPSHEDSQVATPPNP